MKADSPACVLKKKYHMTYGICEEAVYHVYCKTRLASRSNFIVFRIFKIGFQLGGTFDVGSMLPLGINHLSLGIAYFEPTGFRWGYCCKH